MKFVSLRELTERAQPRLAILLLGLALLAGTPLHATAQSGQWWTTVPGESAASLAQALYPRDAHARRSFIDFVMRNNPGLFPAGSERSASSPLPPETRIYVPTPGQVVRTSVRLADTGTARAMTAALSPAPREQADSAPPQSARAMPEFEPQTTPGDRLMVQRDDSDAAIIVAMANDEDVRERVLVDAVDRSINHQLEMLERIRELEDMQSTMHTMLSAELAVGVLAQAPNTPANPAEPRNADPAPAPAADASPRAPTASAHDLGAAQTDRTLAWALLAVAGLLGFWLIHRLTAPAGAPPSRPTPKAAPPQNESVLPPVLAHARPPAVEEKPVLRVGNADNSLQPDDAPLPPPIVRPASDMPAGDGIEDHESAVELAEIMESFGRVHGAAETLAEFIRTNPHQAITPWLKLMDLQQKSGQRAEFEALARELNRAFNVSIITWDNYQTKHTANSDSLERYPHVTQELVEHWRTQRSQAYIDHLLRDNRHGTREGFALPIIEELLMLASILDEQLGRYVPETTRPALSRS